MLDGPMLWRSISRVAMLLAFSGQSDAVDATAVCLVADGDGIRTFGSGGMLGPAEVIGIHADFILQPSQRLAYAHMAGSRAGAFHWPCCSDGGRLGAWLGGRIVEY